MFKYKLVCFDVDGTLIDNVTFSWQVFHDYFQTDEHRRADAQRRFFDGEITYMQWAEHDINLWREKNVKKEDFFRALAGLRLMEGAMETLTELKKHGSEIAKIIPRMMMRLPSIVIPREQEVEFLKQSVSELEKQFSCDVKISFAEESSEAKAKQAMPGKPAIVVR